MSLVFSVGASCRRIYQRPAGPLEGVGGHFGRAVVDPNNRRAPSDPDGR